MNYRVIIKIGPPENNLIANPVKPTSDALTNQKNSIKA